MSGLNHLHLRRLDAGRPDRVGLLWASSTMAQAAEHATTRAAAEPQTPHVPDKSNCRAPRLSRVRVGVTRYRSLRDQPLTDWTALIAPSTLSGWRAYACEAQRDGTEQVPTAAHQQHGGRP